MDRIEEVLGDIEFFLKYNWQKNENGKDYYGLVEFWTDTAGQDIPIDFYFDGTAEDFVREFTEAAESYDVDEEVEIYVGMRGKNGVPNTVRELLDDCQEAKDKMMEIAEKLQEAIAK